MYARMIRGVILGTMFLGLISCGGGSSPTGQVASEKPGRVYVQNETTMIVDVYYVDETGTKIETTIEPGKREEVTRGVVDGGTTIKMNVNPRRNCRSDVEKQVTVDGNRTLRITHVGACGTKQVDTVTI